MAVIKKTDEVPVPELVRPFYWFAGANRLVIACRVEVALFTPVTEPCVVGDRSLIGSPLERETAEALVDKLNREWVFDRSSITTSFIASSFRALLPRQQAAA
jgi:hypothetical protein